jgi:TonB family protein
MSVMADIVLRSSAMAAIGWLAAAALRRQSAAVRHGVLAAALLGAALVAPLSWVVPTLSLPLPPAPWADASAGTPAPRPAGQSPAGVSRITAGQPHLPDAGVATGRALAAVWAAGAAAQLIGLAAALWRLGRTGRRCRVLADDRWRRVAGRIARQYGITRPVTLLTSDAPVALATWGAMRPRVMVPAPAVAWDDQRVHAVLAHELAHVARGDWLVQIAAQVVRAIYWFNPLIALACRRLRHESEIACDDAVLATGVAPDAYAMQLVAVAGVGRRGPTAAAAALPMARRSTLERRIAAMFDHHRARAPLTRHAALILAVSAAALTASLAAARAQDAARPLTGTVYDASGAVLPEVALTLADDRENTWQAASDGAGRFEFPPVAAGAYTLRASLPGFRTLDASFQLGDAGDWTRIVTLQVAEVRESISVRASRPAAQAASSTRHEPVRVRVGGNIKPPTKLLDVKPVYPPAMQQAGLEGVVPLEATIDRTGAVISARVLSSQVHPDFADAALAAVRQWRFSPTLLNGTPVEVRVSVEISFGLED